MTLNILFMSITIKKNQKSHEQHMHDLLMEQLIEENNQKQLLLGDFPRNMF
ncbi:MULTISPECIES: YrzI family small protein [Bacillaceae]|uniref:YrzI family small protein n=1 Tax=Bacillaceae TaxID=186817 RepID=UPI001E50D754|nr:MULTISPECIES: YrzI family small protein [Bacillaceae]MCE4046958.1 YrzI family small protein [Bacillus sp. Au-Bac7]MCM3030061.1 YrzI family small protein [Niallia sp. MER 6]MDL0437795.1 YrzI family small protein [Niallia sp. SS-2023]UPO86654.1 YrzI family small protein [Niallia sp. Man26]